jgi:hypothetical protein
VFAVNARTAIDFVLLGEAFTLSMGVFGAVIVLGTALVTGVLRLPTSPLKG